MEAKRRARSLPMQYKHRPSCCAETYALEHSCSEMPFQRTRTLASGTLGKLARLLALTFFMSGGGR